MKKKTKIKYLEENTNEMSVYIIDLRNTFEKVWLANRSIQTIRTDALEFLKCMIADAILITI